MRNKILSIIFFLVCCVSTPTMAQLKNDKKLIDILAEVPDSLLQAVLSQPETFRYQIIYTRIDRNRTNHPIIKNYYYNVDPHRYFNPASMVKMPLAFLSLEKLNDLQQPGVNKYTSMQFDSGWSKQTRLYTDSTAENGLPSCFVLMQGLFLIFFITKYYPSFF